MTAAILPGSSGPDGQAAMLGVLGGGQLARMFVHAAQAMGYRTAVLDPDADSPAAALSHLHVQSAYDDHAGLQRLQQHCAAITTEFENVPASALAALAAQRSVAPGAEAVSICQRRSAEKAFFASCGVPCAPFALIGAGTDPGIVDESLFPAILKTSQLGYDGKGQLDVATRAGLAAAWQRLGGVDCVLEKRLPLRRELSVIVARGGDGQWVHLPVQQNLHRDGILAVTQVPAPDVSAAQAQQAVALAGRLADALHYVGVLCVEFFVLGDGSLVANEMAPRPHNSGHYSIDACDISQFELQVRCLAGLPLTAPRQHSAALMLNLLGELWSDGAGGCSRTPPWADVLTLPGTHLHLYGKTEARPGRKMGHLSVTAAAADDARRTAAEAARRLGLPAF